MANYDQKPFMKEAMGGGRDDQRFYFGIHSFSSDRQASEWTELETDSYG